MSQNMDTRSMSLLDFLSSLTGYLEDLAQANTGLLGVLEKYQDLLVKGETGEIEKATPELDRHAGEARLIDERRRSLVEAFFKDRGWNGPRNFSAITRRISACDVTDEEAAAFERAGAARMKLVRVLAVVDAQNSLNLTLIGQGMTFADVSLRALLGVDTDRASYGPLEGGDDGPSILDARA